MKFIFQFFDEKNDEYITPKLIITVLKINDIPVDKEEVLKIFDGDDGKKVNFEQFKKIMNEDNNFFSSKSTYV